MKTLKSWIFNYDMVATIGIEAANKPFPRIVHAHAHLFLNVKTILDIGAGRGRFAKYFLLGEYRSGGKTWRSPVRFSVEEYVAVEPYPPSCNALKKIGDPRLKILCNTWEEAKSELSERRYDVVIFWDVLMFMARPPFVVLNEVVPPTKKYFLFSLHPVRSGYLTKKDFRKILKTLDKEMKVVAKSYLNRIYEV